MMKRIWRGAVIAMLAGALVAAQGGAGMAQSGPTMTVSLAQAVQAPVPVGVLVGQPAILRLEGRAPTVIMTTPPGIVHPILHGSDILLVPLRQGNAVLAIGLGDGVSAKLALSVGTIAGARMIALSGPVTAHAQQPAPEREVPRAQPDPDPPSTPTRGMRGTGVEAFINGLSPAQRQALVDYLRSPSLASLSALVRLLNPSQQHVLVEALANPGTLPQGAPQTPQPAPTAAVPSSSPAAAAPPHPATPVAASSKSGQADPGVTVSAQAGIAVHVIPTATQGVLYLSYVIQNDTGKVVRADPRDVEVAGARGPVTIRQMDIGTPGEIAAGSMETGVIALATAGGRVSLTWRLRDSAGDAMPLGIVVGPP